MVEGTQGKVGESTSSPQNSMSGRGKLATDKRPLSITSIGHFANDGSLQVIPLAFQKWETMYQLSKLQLAFIGGAVSLVSLLVAPLVGYLSDRTRKSAFLMSLGVVILSVGILGYGFVVGLPSFPYVWVYVLLLASSAVVGLGSGFYHPLAASVLQSAYSSRNRGLMMGVNGAFGGLGSAAYPVIFSILVVTLSFSGSFLLLGVGGLLAGAIAVSLARGTSRGNMLDKLTHPFSRNSGGTPNAGKNDARPTGMLLNKRVLKAIYVLTIVGFLRALTGQGIFYFLPLFLQNDRSYTLVQAGLLVGLIYLVATAGQLLWGYVSDRLGRRFALGTSTFGVGGAFLIYLLLPPNTPLGLASLVAFGVFTYSAFPLILALAGEIVGKESTGVSNSIVWGVGVVGGSTLGPVLVGLLSENYLLGSLSGALLVTCFPGMIGAFLMFLVPKPNSN